MTTAPVVSATADPAASGPVVGAREPWRDSVARGMLTVFALVGPLLAALGLFVGSTHRDAPDVAVLVSAGILIPVLRLANAVSIRRRAMGGIFVVFATAVYLMARAGLGSGVSDVILTTCVLGGVLFGDRVGLAMIGASALAQLVVGLLMVKRVFLIDPREVDPLVYTTWIRMAAATSLLAVLLMRVIGFVIRHVETHARATDRALEQLGAAHEALRESEERHRSLVDHALDGVLLGTPSGETLEANPALCRLLQWTPEEFRALGRQGIVEQDRRLAAMSEERRLTGKARGELDLIRKDGTRVPVEATASMFLDRHGSPRMSISIRDLTERKRVEREHRILAELGAVLSPIRYDSPLAEVAPMVARDLADLVVFYVLQPDGELHRAALATRDPALAWVSEALMAERSSVRSDHPARRVLREGRPVLRPVPAAESPDRYVETEAQMKALRALNLTSSLYVPLLVGETCLGALGLGSSSEPFVEEDIPLVLEIGRRCALFIESARLHRSEKRATQMRDEVLQILAHDLRNPLGSAMLQLALLRRPPGGQERRSVKPVEALERATRRMSRILEDLLEVTRVESGQLELARARVAPSDIVAQAVESQRESVGRRFLELRAELGTDLPDVWADWSKVLQVLENLIGNATKFTTAGGIAVGAKSDGSEVVFWVTDTGSGIAAEDVPHVFDRFWQAKRTDRSGAGLGLAIVSGIVQAHGGRVWLKSQLGLGSTFFFSLPAVAPSQTGGPN